MSRRTSCGLSPNRISGRSGRFSSCERSVSVAGPVGWNLDSTANRPHDGLEQQGRVSPPLGRPVGIDAGVVRDWARWAS